MGYLSDFNLRAVLTVLVHRAGGEVDITNEELYDAMLPGEGQMERFQVAETPSGITISVKRSEPDQAG